MPEIPDALIGYLVKRGAERDLRDMLARTIRDRVRLTLGPDASRTLAEGRPVILSGREADDAADAALAALAEHGLAVVDLAVRDEELEGLRSQLPQCNGLCLRASDVLDDLSRVVGNPVARAHRSCPLHGDLEAAARELDGALSRAETERDEWRERAEKAEAALAALASPEPR